MTEQIKAAIERADDCLTDCEVLLKEERYIAVVNRSYYAVFYAMTALAIKQEFETSKHQQLLGWFNKTFVKTGLVESEIGKIAHMTYERRLSGDYDLMSVCTKEEAVEMHLSAKRFVNAVKKSHIED